MGISCVSPMCKDAWFEQINASLSTGHVFDLDALHLGQCSFRHYEFLSPQGLFFLFMANCLFLYPHTVSLKKRIFRIN